MSQAHSTQEEASGSSEESYKASSSTTTTTTTKAIIALTPAEVKKRRSLIEAEKEEAEEVETADTTTPDLGNERARDDEIATVANNEDDDDDDDDEDEVQFVSEENYQRITACIDLSTDDAVVASTSAAAKTNEQTAIINRDAPSTSSAAATGSTNNSNNSNNSNNPTSSTTSLDCPICLQSCIHPARLPCGHIFCFLCVKGVAYKNRRCAMCRREIPPEFLDHPQLVNGIDDICSTKSTEDGYQWYYEGRNGGWWAYDKRSSNEIEAAYQRLLGVGDSGGVVIADTDVTDADTNTNTDATQCQLLICGNIYVIDFANMAQYPEHAMTRRRHIRRACTTECLPTKGVAGITKTHH